MSYYSGLIRALPDQEAAQLEVLARWVVEAREAAKAADKQHGGKRHFADLTEKLITGVVGLAHFDMDQIEAMIAELADSPDR